MSVRLAIFASGSGTNAENIIRYFVNNEQISVALLLSNRTNAYVLERARTLDIPTAVFSKEEFGDGNDILATLSEHKIDFIVLAGFLLRISLPLLHAYPGRIINIHPALLPLYGGKGMYGDRVHEAVVAAGESQTGITVHYVDEHYDEGRIIVQERCEVLVTDSPVEVASKVHALEYAHFPKVIEQTVCKLFFSH